MLAIDYERLLQAQKDDRCAERRVKQTALVGIGKTAKQSGDVAGFQRQRIPSKS